MQITMDCNCPKPQPQFGRFLRVKDVNVVSFRNYTKVDSNGSLERPLQRLIKGQHKNFLFDLVYNAQDDSILLKAGTEEGAVLKTFECTGRTKLESMGKNFFTRIRAFFDKTLLLPENLYNADKEATKLFKEYGGLFTKVSS